MAIYHSLCLATLASLAGASAVQRPLTLPLDTQVPIGITAKPLVSSSALQADVSRWNLLDRANHLFGLAQLSKEYNHETRVIGSKGMHLSPFRSRTAYSSM